MSERDGGPAFPHTDIYCEKVVGVVSGMSLRDYFAGQALVLIGIVSPQVREYNDAPTEVIPAKLAEGAYELADAMLKERDKC